MSPEERRELQWHSVHRATPLLNVWRVWAVVIAFLATVAINAAEEGASLSRLRAFVSFLISHGLIWILAGVALLTIVTGIISHLAWRNTAYAISDRGVHLKSGLLVRKDQHIGWERVAAVDTSARLVDRIFGLGSVRIDSSASSDDDVTIGLFRRAEVEKLRRDILERRNRSRLNTEPAPGGIESVGEGSEGAGRVVYRVGAGRLLASTLLSGTFGSVVAAMIGVAVIAYLTGEALTFALVLALVSPAKSLWDNMSGLWGLTIVNDGDTLTLTRGAGQRHTQVIIPDRVHGLAATSPLPWRWRGWWRLQITVAGTADSFEEGSGVDTVVIPVGSAGDVTSIVSLLSGEAAAVYVSDGLAGGNHFDSPPPAAVYLDPLAHRWAGRALTGSYTYTRWGYWTRSLAVVHRSHIQSRRLTQNILQRRLGLATVTAAIIPGPVSWKVRHISVAKAREIAGDPSTLEERTGEREP